MKIHVIIGKTTYLSNLKVLNGQKHHFTYHFLCKVNVYLQALIYIYIYIYIIYIYIYIYIFTFNYPSPQNTLDSSATHNLGVTLYVDDM